MFVNLIVVSQSLGYISDNKMNDDLMLLNFPYGVSGKVWYLIVSIPDICLLLYFYIEASRWTL